MSEIGGGNAEKRDMNSQLGNAKEMRICDVVIITNSLSLFWRNRVSQSKKERVDRKKKGEREREREYVQGRDDV